MLTVAVWLGKNQLNVKMALKGKFKWIYFLWVLGHDRHGFVSETRAMRITCPSSRTAPEGNPSLCFLRTTEKAGGHEDG